MLTDLRLHKYLQGRLSRREEEELENLLEKNPALKNRLEELRNDVRRVTRPAWERIFLDRGDRRGSRVRYTTLLPAFLVLVLILGLTSHWFNKPGRNSTFLHAGGNGTAVELLYNSAQGWRYIGAGFRHGDSLTFAVRDSGRYAVRVYGVYDGLPRPTIRAIWSDSTGGRFGPETRKPIFSSAPSGGPEAAPNYLALVYDTADFLPVPEELLDLWKNESVPRQTPDYKYQVIRVPETR